MAAATQAVRVSELVITSQRKAGSRGRFVPRVCFWAMRWPLRRQRRCDDRGSRQLKYLLGRESLTVGLQRGFLAHPNTAQGPTAGVEPVAGLAAPSVARFGVGVVPPSQGSGGRRSRSSAIRASSRWR